MNGFCNDFVRHLKEIWEIRNIPQIYLFTTFIILRGIVSPTFTDFWYYYVTEKRDFSQMTVGLVQVLGSIILILGSILYEKKLSKWEFRTIITSSNVVRFVAGVVGILFVSNYHLKLGLNDLWCYIIMILFKDYILIILFELPTFVLLAKITPKHIECTVFSFLASTLHWANDIFAPTIGGMINDAFLGITRENMDDSKFFGLAQIETWLSLTPIFLMALIPMR